MRHHWLGAFLAAITAAIGGAAADDRDVAGAFDYYVLALSWNAAWCAAEGDSRNAPQCDPREEYGFLLHGLWPQFERGWPENCPAVQRDPSRRETGKMADLYGSGGLAWYQWKKHGRCSGLKPEVYFAAARHAYGAVQRPEVLRQVGKELRVAPKVIEAAFLEANPKLEPDGVTVICRGGMLREVRICLDKSLNPRPCSGRAREDCRATSTLFVPMR